MLKKIKNKIILLINKIKTRIISQHLPMNQGSPLEKPIRCISVLNLFILTLGIGSFLILTYFYTQTDIIFVATGCLPMPENIHWYPIILGFLAFRRIIFFLTQKLTTYIKNFSVWTEKEKKIAINLLAVINLLTISIDFPLIRSFFAYIRESEIFFNNWFIGTFRRLLNENERENLYQETVKNFLEKSEVSKEIQDSLAIWANENSKAFMEQYDEGSVFATKYVWEMLESQKEFLKLEEIKNLDLASKINEFVEKTSKDQQGWFSGIYDQTMNGLNYFNPWVTDTDTKTCLLAWGIAILTLIGIVLVVQNRVLIRAQEDRNLKLQNLINRNNDAQDARDSHLQNFITRSNKAQEAQDLNLQNFAEATNSSIRNIFQVVDEQNEGIDVFAGEIQNERMLLNEVKTDFEEMTHKIDTLQMELNPVLEFFKNNT